MKFQEKKPSPTLQAPKFVWFSLCSLCLCGKLARLVFVELAAEDFLWVPRQKPAVELVYLFYDGFRIRGQTDKREEPMSNHKQDQACTTLVEKMTLKKPLSEAEKAHLSQCSGCMLEVVLRLDQMAEVSALHAMTGESQDADLPQPNPEVIRALENGRRNSFASSACNNSLL